MSDKEEKSSNDEEKTESNQDEGGDHPKIITEGIVSSDSNKTSGSNRNSAGNDELCMLQDNLELELKELLKDVVSTDASEDANTDQVVAKDGATDEQIDDEDLNSDAFLDKCDEKVIKKADDLDEIEDDDMELRWEDDDDASNHGMGDDNRNSGTNNDGILSEDQLLEDSSDVLIQDKTEISFGGNLKVSEASLNSDVLKINSEENSLILDNSSKEIETNESEICSILPIHKAKDEKHLVDECLNENYLSAEEICSTEIDHSTDKIMDHLGINVLKEKLFDKSEIVTKETVTAPAEEILEDKSMNEPMKGTESVENSLLKEAIHDEQTKEASVPIIDEDQYLTEYVSNTETESSTLKLKSFTDAILDKDNDGTLSEEKLLEEFDSKDESSLIISGKDIVSKTLCVKEAPINKEDNDDALLEERLLQDTETAGVITESEMIMDVDDEEESKLLKDSEYQEDSCTPMDVDNTDSSMGDKIETEEKITDQTTNLLEVVKKDIALLIEDQTIIDKVDETTDEVQNMDQSDDQSEIIDKVIDQPVIDTYETVDIADQTETEKERIDQQIDNQIVSQKETDNQQIDDKTKMKVSNKDQLIVKSNTKEQSIKNLIETDVVTGSNALDILVEDLGMPIPEQPTLKEKIKTDPEELEENTYDINNDSYLDKLEKSREAVNTATNLDVKEEVDEISPNNSLEDLCPIITDHGVHKPDVMLEIPTQEFIDIDDTDLSMNLDHSILIDCLNDDDKNIDSDIVHEDTIAVNLIDDVIGSDKIVTDSATVSEKSVQPTKPDDDKVKVKSVDQKALATESTLTDKIIAKDDAEKSVHQKAMDTEIRLNDKIVADEERVKEKFLDQETRVVDKDIPDEHTVKEKSDTQEAESIVGEVQTIGNTVENDKKIEATVEENMERLFADEEPEVPKEVSECIASTSQLQVPSEQPPAPITRMTPDTSDEVPEIDDSLGLLAESAGRMMEDDEEPEDDFDVDDDDDFDQDESSNQISAEQSEDSNPATLESEQVRDLGDKELETPETKDEEFMMCDSPSQDKAEKMDVEGEFGMVELQAETINEINKEAESAVDALLNADNPPTEEVQDQQETTESMDIETVKLSDTSDNEVDVEPTKVEQPVAESSKEDEEKEKCLSSISPKQSPSKTSQSPCKQSPSKMKNLAISTQGPSSVVNIVFLGESSSSEDEVEEVEKQPEPDATQKEESVPETDVTNVNIPPGIDIMCTSGGSTSEITTKDNLSQVVISGVPKPPPHKPARLNTSEVTIKTATNTEPLIIPETKINEPAQAHTKHKLNLEIFSLDSDDDESAAKEKPSPISLDKTTALEQEKPRESTKCINYCCTSDNKAVYKLAEPAEIAYFDAGRKRRSMVCQPCADVVTARTKKLIQGIKDMTPLVDLDMGKLSQDLVEISDSESEDEVTSNEEPKESIGEKGAKFIEENLAKFLNETWQKYDMDTRLKETQLMLDDEIEKLEQDSKEIDAMLNECQIATDKLRCELYATFECRRQNLPSLTIYDTPESKYIGPENPEPIPKETIGTRQAKRRLSSTSETPAKRPAIPLGYAPLDGGDSKEKATVPAPDNKLDDDKDISVVKLSAEAAPADLPPPGEISRPPLRLGMPVYAMKNAFGPWLKGRVAEIQPKNTSGSSPFSVCLVKFDHKTRMNGKYLHARCIAYSEPADVRMTIGTRLIALFKDSNKRESYYSGVVAEIPNPVNNYRYLVFFDDGYAQYVQHQHTRLVCESSPLVWEEVHPFSREFVRKYLTEYPERPMVRLHEGQHLKTEWNGKWWSSQVTRVDASLAQVMFVGDGRREWIYRGSTRLAPLYLELRAAERHRPRPMPRSKAQPKLNMPYVEYTRSDEQESNKQVDAQAQQQQQQQQQQIQNEEIRRQRAVAKKSTSAPPQVLPPAQVMPSVTDAYVSRVVYYTPKNAVKPLKMVPHKCGPRCKRSDVLSLKELRTYNPLAKPLLSGWERQIVRFKGHKEVMYRAPCGRRLRNMRELHNYLRSIDSDLPVDLFDFHHSTHCLAEFVLTKCIVGKKDLSHGKENVPVPCVNCYDDSLPEFCSYNTERTPTAGVPLNLEPEFLCGCDCTDDCQDKSKCACWKMTLEGARTIGLRGSNLGYVYKRLPEPLPSGIYECNSRCKCKNTCLNRVAQHPLQLKLQVFKTPNRGWGIRALNDVPKGSFLCVYAGNLLTDATANLDGLNEGDEYLAELDYIEVVEQMKEGYEEDIPEADKKLDKKEGKDGERSDEDEPSSSEDEETADKDDKEDDDFRPGYIGLDVTEFNKRLRIREKSKKNKENATGDDKEKDKDTNKEATKDPAKDSAKDPNAEEDCITISDDEEVREPSRFMAQTNMGENELNPMDYVSKYKSVRTLFGKDEACYIMDAKVQGNIGRYLNHSCCPNVFVQNVFVDTHDPRFPWVAFFALSHIKAGTELTWNYNYDVGSVPGKILYCYCGAPNCRGRLL